ncbi:hypothetical protein M885DRAFT_510142 [Pelagophyceae sp. CCMP2097]|nr:hypothetical protein M885DRAFT_510142 [Pelagophyceae sp. CCMP2097]
MWAPAWLRRALLLAWLASAAGRDMNYDEMSTALFALARDHPRYARVFSANEAYKIKPAAGGCGLRNRPCEQLVVVVSHFPSLPQNFADAGTARHEAQEERATVGQRESATRPHVFVSGALHGDERVGPLATLWGLEILVHAAACTDAGHAAAECPFFSDAERRAVSHGGRAAARSRVKWLARLVRRRVVYAMPMTNARGFSTNQRTENGIDTNRDFPIDTTPTACMRSVTARCVNELWRRHVFVLALTFHGGMEALAYEWGAPSHNSPRGNVRGARASGDTSPDDASQRTTAEMLSAYAGRFGRVPNYASSRMNSIVYPVHGGMEDWAYAASWDKPLNVRGGCSVEGYAAQRSAQYANATHRAFMLLVETSNAKGGAPMGARGALFDAGAADAGHAPRNVRLMLAALDVVEPYVRWRHADGAPRPAAGEAGSAAAGCVGALPGAGAWLVDALDPEPVRRLEGDGVLRVEVGGALHVDAAKISWGCWDAAAARRAACAGARGLASAPGPGSAVPLVLAQLNSSAPAADSPQTRHALMGFFPYDDAAQLCGPDGRAWAVARASVDADWGRVPRAGAQPPGSAPQTHFANVRSNAEWAHAHNGHVVLGRSEWFAAPLLIDLGRRPPTRTLANAETPRVLPTLGLAGAAGAAATATVRARRRRASTRAAMRAH